MFMTNFKVAGQKMTGLQSFHVLCVFCIFGIEKVEISKKIFSKGYFIIRFCTFMINLKVAGLKTTELLSFYVLCVFSIFGSKKF